MSGQRERIMELRQAVVDGEPELACGLVEAALQAGVDPQLILDEGLTGGAEDVGRLFEEGQYFLPELMRTGMALKATMEIVVPRLGREDPAKECGIVVMATIKSDVHDIGKNLVSSMLAASGFVVHDLGVDVPINRILDEAARARAHIIGCSALLTTSAPYLRELVSTITARGLRSKYKIMIGGAAVTQAFADGIGADGTAPSAAGAVQLARKLMGTA